MGRGRPVKWTEGFLRSYVSQFASYPEFRAAAPGDVAQKARDTPGLLVSVFPDYKPRDVLPRGWWTEDRARAGLVEGVYADREDLALRNRKLSDVCYREFPHLLVEFFGYSGRDTKKPNGYWTEEQARAELEAGAFASRGDLRDQNWALLRQCYEQFPHLLEEYLPDRAYTGYRTTLPGRVYLFEITLPCGAILWKVGITNKTAERRMRGFRLRSGVSARLVADVRFEDGARALALETAMLRVLRDMGVAYDGRRVMVSGNRELFRIDPLVILHALDPRFPDPHAEDFDEFEEAA